jgi:putative ABC transport system substrate-binding protein
VKRRSFVGLLGGTMPVWADAVRAQQSKVPKLGVFVLGAPDPTLFLKELDSGLRDLGYVDGQTIQIELLSAGGKSDLLPSLAAELVRRKVDIIVAWQTPVIAATAQATREIPIVMGASADPVGSGFIQSLGRPGGNVTGVAQPTAALSAKSIEFIRELLPRAQRVAMLAYLVDPFHKTFLEQVTLAGRSSGLEMQPVIIRDPDHLESAFAQVAGEKVDAIVVQPSLPIERTADLALQYRVPATCSSRAFVVAGGLLGYVANVQEQYRKVATYVDRVLKGAKPTDLPVQEPTTFELLLNIKTAQTLGLTIPPSILLRADKVIE